MAEHLVSQTFVGVGPLAYGKVTAFTLLALTASNSERNHHAVSDFYFFHVCTHFHHLAHKFATHDVAMLHSGHGSIVQVQVRPADGATANFDNSVERLLYAGVGDVDI